MPSAMGRNRRRRGVGSEVPIRVIEMKHEVTLDIFWNIGDGVPVMNLSMIRWTGGLCRIRGILHAMNDDC